MNIKLFSGNVQIKEVRIIMIFKTINKLLFALIVLSLLSCDQGNSATNSGQTTNQTRPLNNQTSPFRAREKSEFFFVANDGIAGNELWVTDGTEPGTRLVKDITVDGDSKISEITTYDGLTYFVLETENEGSRTDISFDIWRTDGSEENTQIFAEDFNAIYDLENALYFASGSAFAKLDQDKLSPTVNPFDLNPLGALSFSDQFDFVFSFGEEMIFLPETIEPEIWKTDGTLGGTNLINNLENQFNFTFISARTKNHMYLLFRSLSAEDNRLQEVWKTDGTIAGTTQVEVFPNVFEMSSLNEYVYIIAQNPSSGKIQLYRQHEDANETPDLLVGFDNFAGLPLFTVSMDDTLYLTAPNTFGRAIDEDSRYNFFELWAIQNGDTTPSKITEISAALLLDVFEYDSQLYFLTLNGSNERYELWKTNGTEQGTEFVIDFNEQPIFQTRCNSIYAKSRFNAIEGQGIIFSLNSEIGEEMWITDGTPRGTSLVKDINLGEKSGFNHCYPSRTLN